MKKLLIISMIIGLGWYGNYYYRQQQELNERKAVQGSSTTKTQSAVTTSSPFRCDGRIYCSQMTSCAEAKFFLSNCPGVKMDGNHDGVPCEKQWCN